MVQTKHERTIEMEDMVIDTLEQPPLEKRQKKKQAPTNRRPLCTFVNYLGPKNEAAPRTTVPDVDMLEDIVEVSSCSGEMKKLSLENTSRSPSNTSTSLDDCSSTTSVETVNTSNKSVDAMVRDDRFNFESATPAQDRWKEPPPAMAMDALYVTSRCESDTESEDESPAKPREIVVRTRGRCPRLHRWQNRNQQPSMRHSTARAPKFQYKI